MVILFPIFQLGCFKAFFKVAFFDFIFSYGGINLAPFLGGLAVVSPIIFIAVGTILMGTSGKSGQRESSESDEYDTQRTEKSGVELMEEEESKKKKKKSKKK